jgi:dipeptidyl aminopeptidase/acylaminoacyl peptidase
LYQRLATGAGSDELLLTTPLGKQASDWSADDRFVLYRSQHPQTRYDIWALPLQGDRKPFAVVQTGVDERDAQFSPDGKWIAYESDESGRFEIYVRPFPGPGPAWPVSTDGGAQVRWGRDGRELFYVSLDERLLAVSVRLDAQRQAVEADSPRPLFAIRVGGAVGVTKQQYAVSADGREFLIRSLANQPDAPPIGLILNWKGSSR